MARHAGQLAAARWQAYTTAAHGAAVEDDVLLLRHHTSDAAVLVVDGSSLPEGGTSYAVCKWQKGAGVGLLLSLLGGFALLECEVSNPARGSQVCAILIRKHRPVLRSCI